MRGRKLLSGALAAALALCLAAPALAEGQSADKALEAVTAKVKTTLGLDTEIFTDFQGWADEDVLLGKRWNLEWEGDGVGLSITADDTGKIYSYNYRQSVDDTPEVYRGFGGRLNIPQLPQDKSAGAFEAAKAFLGKVLESGVESVELENNYSPSLYQDTYRYSGEVLLNGLSSPISCSVSVRASDLQVLRFWRGDQYAGYLGGVPAAATNTTEAQARTLLRPTIEMKARYVLEPDGKTAKVRYVPVSGDDYYVDGATGKLVDLTELRQKLWEGDGGANKVMFTEAAADMAAGAAEEPEASLTQAEKDGAAILAAALSKEELDKLVQTAWPQIGLEKYTLSSASFSVREKDIPEGQARTSEDYDVTCRLSYSRQEGQVSRNKYVTVDAKTGQLQSLYSRRYYRGEDKETLNYAATLAQGQATADVALKTFAGTHYAVLGLFESSDAQGRESWEHTYSYQHTDGTYFYDGNAYLVGVDATDGTLSQLSGYFNDDVTLVVPTSVISADQAADIYLAAMAVPYGYREVPVSITVADAELIPLLKEAGYSYVNSLKTGYVLAQPQGSYVQGVYAQDGQVAARKDAEPTPDQALTYDDLEGHWVKSAADALATFGIGLRGGSLKPGQGLTQLDMIALLVSVDGYSYDPATASKDETDRLYNRAYSLGLVTPETRNETKPVTRGELVRLILDAAGYARIAALPGIFRCDFADSAAIPAYDVGYAALAQGLGLVKGGSDGSYAAGRPATRAEAVAMLYQYMK